MNFIKRAYLHTTRKKGKTILMFSILLIISTLILICFSIHTAINVATINVRKSLSGSFTINAKQLENGITEKDISNILSIDGVKHDGYTMRSYKEANFLSSNEKSGLHIKTKGASKVPTGYEHAGKLIGSSNSSKDTYFTEAGFKLIQGTAIAINDKNTVLVHDFFAKANDFKLNDEFTLQSLDDTNKQVDVKIIGIFTNTKEQDSLGIAPSYDLYENIMFTDVLTTSQLLYEDSEIHAQYVDFTVTDPEMLESVISKVEDIKSVSWQDCIISKYDKDYQNAKASLNSLQNIVLIAMIVIISISIILLALILSLWIRNRIHEFGVFLSIGFSKCNIFLQQLLEICLIAVFAFSVSFLISSFTAQIVGDNLAGQVSEQNSVKSKNLIVEDSEEAKSKPNIYEIGVSVSLANWIVMCGVGFCILLCATGISAYPLMRLNPKKILSEIN